MNQRIQELAQQAEMSANKGDHVDVKLMMEKFAAAIVRECAKFLEDNSGYDECNNAWHPEPEDLLNHFGVEE